MEEEKRRDGPKAGPVDICGQGPAPRYDVDRVLELLELYMDLTEKQDEIIYRLSRILAQQETDLQLLLNDREFSDSLEEDKAIANEVISQYERMKGTN